MAVPLRTATTRAAQAEQTRAQILETAQRLFAEQGYDATSLQMIADELGLTKAAVYYHFRAKNDLLHAAMLPGIQWIGTLLDEAALIRSRRGRAEHLVNGYVNFLVENRHLAVMASSDPAMKRDKSDQTMKALRQRSLELLFGEQPSGAEQVAFHIAFSAHDRLPELVDLTDGELRKALRTTLLRLLRVPARCLR